MTIQIVPEQLREFSRAAVDRRATYVLIYDHEDQEKSYSMKSAIGLNSSTIDKIFRLAVSDISKKRVQEPFPGKPCLLAVEAFRGQKKVVESQWMLTPPTKSMEKKDDC